MVGFVAHPVFPTIYRDMKKPAHYNRLIVITFIIVGGYYCTVAVLGYMIWGQGVGHSITVNVHSGTLGKVNNVLILLLPLTKYAMTMEPITQVGRSAVATATVCSADYHPLHGTLCLFVSRT